MGQLKTGQFVKKIWPYLIIIMAIIIGIQSFWLVRLYGQIDQKEKNFSEEAIVDDLFSDLEDQNELSIFPDNPFRDNYFGNPFDPNTWDPFQEMQRMQDHMNSMFGDAFGRFSRSPKFDNLFDSGSFTPEIDIKDEGDYLIVKIDLPGADNNNVNITCTNQELKISGKIEQLQEDRKRTGLLRRERRSGHFSRTITLPVPVEADKMETEIDKGIVTIKIPKAIS
jgi:HSP20 family protein